MKSLIAFIVYCFWGILLLRINYTMAEISVDQIDSALYVMFWPFVLMWYVGYWVAILGGLCLLIWVTVHLTIGYQDEKRDEARALRKKKNAL